MLLKRQQNEGVNSSLPCRCWSRRPSLSCRPQLTLPRVEISTQNEQGAGAQQRMDGSDGALSGCVALRRAPGASLQIGRLWLRVRSLRRPTLSLWTCCRPSRALRTAADGRPQTLPSGHCAPHTVGTTLAATGHLPRGRRKHATTGFGLLSPVGDRAVVRLRPVVECIQARGARSRAT